jgi:hypothetical protein
LYIYIYITVTTSRKGRDSSVGIATGYGLDGRGIESRGAIFSVPVQTGPGAHPVSCTLSTGSFLRVKRPGRGADPSPLLVQRSKKQSRAISLLSLRAFVAYKKGKTSLQPADRTPTMSAHNCCTIRVPYNNPSVAYSRLASQEIPRFICNPKVQNNLLLAITLCQLNPIPLIEIKLILVTVNVVVTVHRCVRRCIATG